jgi:hypothetical protein
LEAISFAQDTATLAFETNPRTSARQTPKCPQLATSRPNTDGMVIIETKGKKMTESTGGTVKI